MLRHQLTAYSPISVRTIWAATTGASANARTALASLLRQRFAAREVLLCGSGTQALQIALQLQCARIGPNAIVALPAFQCYDVATAAIAIGNRVMLYDIDPETLGPDLASLERVLSAGARVVVVAPLYGIPVPWDLMAAMAKQYGAALIEDAAQGHGASWDNSPLGSLADVSTLSFGRGKGWTGGGGGAVLARGATTVLPDLHGGGRARDVRTVVGLMAQWTLGRPGLYGIPRSIPMLHLGETTYRDPEHETSMTNAAASAVIATRSASDDEAVSRRRMANAMIGRLQDSKRCRFASVPPGGVGGYLRLPVRIPGGVSGLASAKGAQELGLAQSYPTSLAHVGALAKQIVQSTERYPGADELVRDLITLPAHSRVTDRERDEIVALLR